MRSMQLSGDGSSRFSMLESIKHCIYRCDDNLDLDHWPLTTECQILPLVNIIVIIAYGPIAFLQFSLIRSTSFSVSFFVSSMSHLKTHVYQTRKRSSSGWIGFVDVEWRSRRGDKWQMLRWCLWACGISSLQYYNKRMECTWFFEKNCFVNMCKKTLKNSTTHTHVADILQI